MKDKKRQRGSTSAGPKLRAQRSTLNAGSVLDITEQKEAEQAQTLFIEDLNRSQQYFRALFNYTPSAVGVSTVAEGRLCDVNEEFSQLTGYTREELLGRTTLELGLWADPSERVTVLREIQDQGYLHNREGLLRTKSGEIRSLMVTVDLIHLGSTPCLIYLAHDITERKRAEQQLRRSEQELADFFENATIGLHWVGPDGIILRANRAELILLGYTADEYVGHHIAEFHADQEVIVDILRRLTAGEKLHDYEARLRCKDGSVRHVLISSSVFWEDGRFVHTRCFTHDITERKLTEEALKQSEERFGSFVRSTDDGIVTLDHLGLITFWNPGAERLFGYAQDEVLGKPMALLMPERFRKRHERGVERASAAGRLTAAGNMFELVGLRKDGTEFPIEISLSSWSARNGLFFTGIVRDITKRKQVEKILSESEERFRSLVDVITDVPWTTDPEGQFVTPQEAYSRYTGASWEELRGHGWAQCIHPDDREQLVHIWKHAVATRTKYKASCREWHDPTQQWRHVIARGTPVFNPDGSVREWVGSLTDVNEQYETEAALQKSEERYHSIFQNAVDGIFQTTADGKYVAVNPALARIYGYDSPDDLIATITDIAGQLYVDPGRRDEFLRLMQAQEEVTSFEALVYRKDGSFMWISESARTLRDQAGTVVGYEGTVKDITERKRAEGRLRATLDQVRTLSGRLTTVQEEERTRIARELHDELGVKLTCLKIDLSRLTSIVGNRVRADLRAKLNNRVRSMVREVDRTIASLQRLVTQLRPALLDNLGLVAALEWQGQDFQKRTGISCTYVTNAGHIAMEPELATAVFRICQESLTNTARHAQATAVTITVTSQPNSLELVVADNGVGVSDTKTSDRRSLGLTGMQERAAQWGGTVTIAGDPDRGTTVTLCLPVGGGGTA